MWGTVAAMAVKAASEGDDSPAQAHKSSMTDYSGGIVVSPVGVNLGEIFKTFNEGGPETGGYGYSLPARMAADDKAPASKFNQAMSPVVSVITNPIFLGVGLIGVLVLIKR